MARQTAVLAALVAAISLAAAQPARSKALTVFIGTYSGPLSKGIYRASLDLETGALGVPTLAAECASPSFLALSPNGRYLYAVHETGKTGGRQGGAVSAYRIEPGDLSLTPLGEQASQGTYPCHVSVDPSGRTVLVANYGSGTFASFPVRRNGSLGAAASVVKVDGTGPNKGRQEGPHAHGIYPTPDKNRVVAVDLGTDRVLVYNLDAATAALTAADPPFAAIAPGSGPRHLAFAPNGKHAYVINELVSTVTTCAYDAKRGALTPGQTVRTLPEGFAGVSHTSEIFVHPGGKWVYGSNRGHDSIAVYSAHARTGELKLVEIAPMQGKTPRGFAIDPMGTFLIVGNQDSNTVSVFRIDATTGKLTYTGHSVEVGAPVCVVVHGMH